MSLDAIAPIPSEPVEPAAAPEPQPAPEPTQEPVQERDEPAAPLTADDLAERLSNAEKAAARLSRERKEAREELERERLIRKELTEQFQALRPRPQQPEVDADAEPDPQTDPEAWLRWNFAEARKAADEVKAWKKAQQDALRQQDEFKTLMADTVRDYTAFAEEEAPDFHEAYAFIKDTLTKQYEETPIFENGRWRKPTQAEINQQLAADEAGFVRQVRAAGGRAGPAIYEYAQMRGYKRSVQAAQLAEGDRRRADAERVRGLPAAASASTGDAQLTYEWVVENIDSPDAGKRARAEKAWSNLNNLPRKR